MTEAPKTAAEALALLTPFVEEGRAAGMADYHKAPRDYLGVPNPALNDLSQAWRGVLTVPERVALADDLWKTNIYEARILAAKLLTQARIKDDGAVWDLIVSWVPDFDSWAIADHAMMAGQKRLVADMSRIETVAGWTTSAHHWTKRAAMVITLPFTKQNHPKPEELAIRQRVMGWAADYVHDAEWFIQKSVAWWLRELSKHDPERVAYFMSNHAKHMKPFARREAEKHMAKPEAKPAAPSKPILKASETEEYPDAFPDTFTED